MEPDFKLSAARPLVGVLAAALIALIVIGQYVWAVVVAILLVLSIVLILRWQKDRRAEYTNPRQHDGTEED
ncbi:hypothetical protein C5B94_03155 [Clavibacter michiganensis]|uniref:hypothetical protein n=1 Tax=Clavibacter michiganensis TaxID=28447 RepID=UPI000D49ED04|nr:hypothetical protein [Clavibacter michiganensis]PPF56434.1 hypothetical protein C5B94_03155 [Clavibacter michiganensis]